MDTNVKHATQTPRSVDLTALLNAIDGIADKGMSADAVVVFLLNNDKRSVIVDAAKAIEAKHKEREPRNLRLSALRVSMRRACKRLAIDPLTVKKVAGKWSVVATAVKTADEDQKLAKALAIVVANIANDTVVKALAEAMQA